MGAILICIVITAKTKKEFDKKWKAEIKKANDNMKKKLGSRSLSSDEKAYSGSVMSFGEGRGLVSKTVIDLGDIGADAAETFIADHHEKFNEAMVLKIGDRQYMVGGWAAE